MKCLACHKELGKKEVVFTEDKHPYCINPFACSNTHPNSVANIVARGGAIKMLSEEELENNLFNRTDISDEMKDRIMKVATKPQSIRLSKYEIAHYLLQLQEVKELSSISEAVRYCVNLAMEMEPIRTEQETTMEKEFKTFIKTGELRDPITNPVPPSEVHEVRKGVTIVPKVQDLIMQQIDQKEEEEFSF